MLFALLTLMTALAQDGTGSPEPLDEEAPVAQTFEEKGWVPPHRSVGFVDREKSGDCDPIDERFGRCIELVDFYQPTPAWVFGKRFSELSKPEQSKVLALYPGLQDWVKATEKERKISELEDVARMKGVSVLTNRLWEELSFRWNEEDPISQKLSEDGFQMPPNTTSILSTLKLGRSSSITEPSPSSVLATSDWYQIPLPLTSPSQDPALQSLRNRPALFPRVRYAIPKAHFVEPTPSVVLKGRFAERLGYNNRDHDYNLMDADPESSGPFFEQIYPYRTAYRGEDKSLVPLARFRYPKLAMGQDTSKLKNMIRVKDYDSALFQSSLQFSQFYRLVATQVMQFAMQDYTKNHMRILGSLTTMRAPPGFLESSAGISRSLNASAQGQTDTKEQLAGEINKAAYSIPGGFQINFAKLPELLVTSTLQRLTTSYPPQTDYYMTLTMEARNMFGNLMRTSRPTIIKGTSDEVLLRWVSENMPSAEVSTIIEPLRRLTLRMLLGTLEKSNRDLEETRILLDHLNFSILNNLDSTVGVRVSPNSYADMVSAQWEAVLADHMYTSTLINQGLGAIDPTAVCTTGSRVAALDETTIGAMYVDQIFRGRDNVRDPSIESKELLWEARYQLPVLFFDNPDATPPSVERLVGLPDGEAVYRARWTLWSGWHLAWGIEPFEGSDRLVLRTAAICDAMVLTSPDLVPTLVRGGLLEDQFFPTIPAKFSDTIGRSDYPSAKERQERRRKNRKQKDVNRNAILGDINKSILETKTSIADVDNLSERLGNAAAGKLDLSASDVKNIADADLANRGLGSDRRDFLKKPIRVDTTETVEYLRLLVRRPLEELAAQNGGLILMIIDQSQDQKWSILNDTLPLTPYARHQEVISAFGSGGSPMGYSGIGSRVVKMAGWGLYFDKDPESKEVVKVGPDYAATEGYLAGDVVPYWKRGSSTDTTFVGDVALFPYRKSVYSCNDSINNSNLSSVERCDPNQEYSNLTEGLSIGFGSYLTRWVVDEPRLAYEIGLEMHLDMLHPGKSWFYGERPPDVTAVVDRFDSGSSSSLELTPSYSWSFRPQTGASFGFRHLPNPTPHYSAFQPRTVWGAPSPAGGAARARYEWGARGAFLIGPTFNGLEGTIVAEAWVARSIRSDNSDWAYFTPFQPITNGGLFFRYQRGGVLMPAETTRMFDLLYSDTYVVGYRSHFRLPGPRPQ